MHPRDALRGREFVHSEIGGEAGARGLVFRCVPQPFEKFLQELGRRFAREGEREDFLRVLSEREQLDATGDQLVRLAAARVG